MGLTVSSVGQKVLEDNFENLKEKCNYTIALAGNPNVREEYYF